MLFLKECKKVARSLVFWIYCAIVALMFFTQYAADCGPVSVGTFDDYKIVENHDLIMERAVNTLMDEFTVNQYVCYPFGFYKSVSLKEKDDRKVEEYIQEMLGTDHAGLEALLESHLCGWMNTDHEEIEKMMEANKISSVLGLLRLSPENRFDDIAVKEGLTYERFTEIMGEIDDILGGGSNYKTDNLVYNYSGVPMEYEEALAEYNVFIGEDKITYALARLYSDYTGIDLALFPVFVAAVFTAADRRRRMTELIYTRKISSAKLVCTRYAALVTTMYIPVFITMVIALIQALVIFKGQSMDITAMFTLPTFWLLPNIMTATATGMLLTEIFSAGVAIAVQFIWAFLSLMSGSARLCGDISKFGLICRHNTIGHRDLFMQTFGDFVFNRIFFMILSLAAAAAAAYVYNLKRGGRFHGIRLFGEGGILRRKT